MEIAIEVAILIVCFLILLVSVATLVMVIMFSSALVRFYEFISESQSRVQRNPPPQETPERPWYTY